MYFGLNNGYPGWNLVDTVCDSFCRWFVDFENDARLIQPYVLNIWFTHRLISLATIKALQAVVLNEDSVVVTQRKLM